MSHESLTPAEAERLEMLAEEAAEVVQTCTKILRHGYESWHPEDPRRERNRAALNRELRELLVVSVVMSAEGDIQPVSVDLGIWRRKLRWTHHQRPMPESAPQPAVRGRMLDD